MTERALLHKLIDELYAQDPDNQIIRAVLRGEKMDFPGNKKPAKKKPAQKKSVGTAIARHFGDRGLEYISVPVLDMFDFEGEMHYLCEQLPEPAGMRTSKKYDDKGRKKFVVRLYSTGEKILSASSIPQAKKDLAELYRVARKGGTIRGFVETLTTQQKKDYGEDAEDYLRGNVQEFGIEELFSESLKPVVNGIEHKQIA